MDAVALTAQLDSNNERVRKQLISPTEASGLKLRTVLSLSSFKH